MSLVYICAKIDAVVVYPTSKQFLCKDRLNSSHPKGKKKKAYLTSLDFFEFYPNLAFILIYFISMFL